MSGLACATCQPDHPHTHQDGEPSMKPSTLGQFQNIYPCVEESHGRWQKSNHHIVSSVRFLMSTTHHWHTLDNTQYSMHTCVRIQNTQRACIHTHLWHNTHTHISLGLGISNIYYRLLFSGNYFQPVFCNQHPSLRSLRSCQQNGRQEGLIRNVLEKQWFLHSFTQRSFSSQ